MGSSNELSVQGVAVHVVDDGEGTSGRRQRPSAVKIE